VTVRYTHQGCKVETRYIVHPNCTRRTDITLSVDPASELSLVVEERAGQQAVPEKVSPVRRVRSTKYGFELYERRP
jgi:hypothetical protein